jgi:DNA-binding transcriptional ArsR family regulator
MIHPEILDLSAVPPPKLARIPLGRSIPFDALVESAGMKQVVSSFSPPEVRVHAGTEDFKVPRPGCSIYCIGGARLPAEPRSRAREILRRLAYGGLDWAAREVVARFHRDLRRSEATSRPAPEGLPASVVVRRAVRSRPGMSIGEIAAITGVAQPNVSRLVRALVAAGELATKRDGRRTLCFPVPSGNELTRTRP